MFLEDYIDNDTRVVTRRVEDRQECAVYYITTVEKRGFLNWASIERNKTYVKAEAERNHDSRLKEQTQIREQSRQKELERSKEQSLKDLEVFNIRERQRRLERERGSGRGR